MNTVTPELVLAKSTVLLNSAQPVDADGSGTLTLMIILMICSGIVTVRLALHAFRPFAEVVKVAFAALGAVLLLVTLLIMLVAALAMSTT